MYNLRIRMARMNKKVNQTMHLKIIFHILQVLDFKKKKYI